MATPLHEPDDARFDHLFDTAHSLASKVAIPPAGDCPYTLFIGAGASVSSGVRPAAALINSWQKDLFGATTGVSIRKTFDTLAYDAWLASDYPRWLDDRLRGRTRESEYAVLFGWGTAFRETLDAVNEADSLFLSSPLIADLHVKDRRGHYYNAVCAYALRARGEMLSCEDCTSVRSFYEKLARLDPTGEDREYLKEETGYSELASILKQVEQDVAPEGKEKLGMASEKSGGESARLKARRRRG